MEQSLILVLLYALLPASGLVLGGALVATHHLLGYKIRSAIQHFAAGAVFAAVALEMLPRVVNDDAPLHMVFGFLLGLVMMFIIKALTERLRSSEKPLSTTSLIATSSGIGIDLFVDGLLISIAFLAGPHAAILIAFALVIEELFLGMSTGQLLNDKKNNYRRQILMNSIFALLILLGAWVGFGVINVLSPSAYPFILSFGMAALLYLVTGNS